MRWRVMCSLPRKSQEDDHQKQGVRNNWKNMLKGYKGIKMRGYSKP